MSTQCLEGMLFNQSGEDLHVWRTVVLMCSNLINIPRHFHGFCLIFGSWRCTSTDTTCEKHQLPPSNITAALTLVHIIPDSQFAFLFSVDLFPCSHDALLTCMNFGGLHICFLAQIRVATPTLMHYHPVFDSSDHHLRNQASSTFKIHFEIDQ
jgi:hypothetical protein